MRVFIGESKIGGERGLFVNTSINRGGYICILPIDYLNISSIWYSLQKDNIGPVNFRYGIKCDLTIPQSDKNVSVFGTFMNFLSNSKIRNSLKIELSGVSNSDKLEGDFLGHMINDYVNMSLLNRTSYEKISNMHENVIVENTLGLYDGRLGLRIFAKKDIKSGEELFFSYGVDYWKNYSGLDKFELLPEIHYIELR